MDRSTVRYRKAYWAALLALLIVGAGLVWVALPTRAGFVSLESQGRSRNQAIAARQGEGESQYIAPYVPTPPEVVDRMLELADLREGDLLFDLGSGDGRIVIAAARRYRVKAVGFEINPVLVKDSRDSIREAGLGHLVEIRDEDIRTVDFSPATVLTMYLYPGANLRLRSAIRRQLKPGARVISHNYGMGNWKPDRIEQLTDSAGFSRTIYVWRILQTQ